jgi:hypothetical protein
MQKGHERIELHKRLGPSESRQQRMITNKQEQQKDACLYTKQNNVCLLYKTKQAKELMTNND